MRNQNCETIEAMMQKIKIQTGENEAETLIRSSEVWQMKWQTAF